MDKKFTTADSPSAAISPDETPEGRLDRVSFYEGVRFAVTSEQKRLSVSLSKMIVGLCIFLLIGTVLLTIFRFQHISWLPADAITVLMGLFGYVAFEVLAVFSRWVRSDPVVKVPAASLPQEKPEDYAPGLPPKWTAPDPR
jgi:uncharacterized membrane protein YoaT (DUF817 family)